VGDRRGEFYDRWRFVGNGHAAADRSCRDGSMLGGAMNEAHTPLAAWESFYVIVGSSGAALTGLQFIVITLVAESRRRQATTTNADTIGAFATPQIVHFGAVLLLAAVLTAPWERLSSVALVLGMLGLTGVLYELLVLRRALRQSDYEPVFEDWLFHTALPLLSYGIVLAAAVALPRHTRGALFAVGTVSVLLLVIGIHNAWDTVTYMTALDREAGAPPKPEPAEQSPPTKEP
jgi:hypothetical protein